MDALFGLFVTVYVFCFLSGADVDLLVVTGVGALVDVCAILCASFSVSGGRFIGC